MYEVEQQYLRRSTASKPKLATTAGILYSRASPPPIEPDMVTPCQNITRQNLEAAAANFFPSNFDTIVCSQRSTAAPSVSGGSDLGSDLLSSLSYELDLGGGGGVNPQRTRGDRGGRGGGDRGGLLRADNGGGNYYHNNSQNVVGCHNLPRYGGANGIGGATGISGSIGGNKLGSQNALVAGHTRETSSSLEESYDDLCSAQTEQVIKLPWPTFRGKATDEEDILQDIVHERVMRRSDEDDEDCCLSASFENSANGVVGGGAPPPIPACVKTNSHHQNKNQHQHHHDDSRVVHRTKNSVCGDESVSDSSGRGTASTSSVHKKTQYHKTKLCPWHKEGKCFMGASCNYAHSKDELKPKPDLSKTRLCPEIVKNKKCDKPGCRFAHDFVELRATSTFFKTRLCKFYQRGCCPAGGECRHAHGAEDLRNELLAAAEHARATAAAAPALGQHQTPALLWPPDHPHAHTNNNNNNRRDRRLCLTDPTPAPEYQGPPRQPQTSRKGASGVAPLAGGIGAESNAAALYQFAPHQTLYGGGGSPSFISTNAPTPTDISPNGFTPLCAHLFGSPCADFQRSPNFSDESSLLPAGLLESPKHS